MAKKDNSVQSTQLQWRQSIHTNSPRKIRTSTFRNVLLALTVLSIALWLRLALLLDSAGDDRRTNDSQDQAKISTISTNAKLPQHKEQTIPQNLIPKKSSTPKATVAYAVSLTSCGHTGSRSDPNLHEGAAVLQHSIYLSSHSNPASTSKYAHKLFAFVHPEAEKCSDIFSRLGYEVQIHDTPFNVSDIRGQFLKEHIVKSGCCGEKEYLKLYAYTLLDYPIVVHLDLDSLVLKPLDDLFDVMLESDDGLTDDGTVARSRIPVMFDEPIPKQVDAFFTRDYNMINPGHKHVGVQGGFLVVRPSLAAFEEYVSIVLEGNFKQGNGWGAKGYGGYFGAQQIQGICSYYYDYKHPGTAVELNRCYYNAMVDSPRQESSNKCRDGRPTCQDCRETPVDQIKSVHFTLCQKPWNCPQWTGLSDATKQLCRSLHAEWFRIRDDLEKSIAIKHGAVLNKPSGQLMPEVFRGYCEGRGGYIPIRMDYG